MMMMPEATEERGEKNTFEAFIIRARDVFFFLCEYLCLFSNEFHNFFLLLLLLLLPITQGKRKKTKISQKKAFKYLT